MAGFPLHGAGGYEYLNRDGIVISLFSQDFQEVGSEFCKDFLIGIK